MVTYEYLYLSKYSIIFPLPSWLQQCRHPGTRCAYRWSIWCGRRVWLPGSGSSVEGLHLWARGARTVPDLRDVWRLYSAWWVNIDFLNIFFTSVYKSDHKAASTRFVTYDRITLPGEFKKIYISLVYPSTSLLKITFEWMFHLSIFQTAMPMCLLFIRLFSIGWNCFTLPLY